MYEHMQRENVANNLKNGEPKNGEQFEFHYSRKTINARPILLIRDK